MAEVDSFSALVADIYDAALNPALWPAVLGETAAFVGGQAAGLYIKDASIKSGQLFVDDGSIDRRWVGLYFDKYIKLDPSTTAFFFAGLDEPIATADYIDYDEFMQTRFYKEWVRPQGLVDSITCVLNKTATAAALCSVFRGKRDGLVDEATRGRMRLIAPHIRRAVLIGRVIDLKTAEAATFADALDDLAAGMFLLSPVARIIHANTAGHQMLNTGAPLRASGDRLVASDPSADQAIHEALLASASGDAALGVKGITLTLAAPDGAHHVAHILPLTAGKRRRTSSAFGATAALFVHRAAPSMPAAPEVMARAYKLTPSELRVLLALVEIGGVPEVAEALGVAETTVKFHLRRLFEKTGTHRQADLAKLVSAFASPVAG